MIAVLVVECTAGAGRFAERAVGASVDREGVDAHLDILVDSNSDSEDN